MAVQVKPALESLLADLKRVGFTGSHYDPERVNPPAAVWIQPRTIRDLTLGGGGTLVVWLYVLAPAGDDYADTLGKLDDSLEGIDELGLPFDSESDEPVDLAASVLLPDHTTPLPAYRLAVEIELGD